MRIGIVLNQYPVGSETFINTFLDHLDEHQVTLFARLNDSSVVSKNWIVKSYLNKIPPVSLVFGWLTTFFSIPFYFKRLLILEKRGVPFKQIITDAPIWTTRHLDILHFPFGNNAIGREHYADLLGAKMTISFRGSDLNVYPIYHNYTYASLWHYVHTVHCNSRELADKLKIHNIPPSIPVTVITPALRKELTSVDITGAICSENTGTATNPLIITTIGRLHWVKDYPFALRILAVLKKKGVIFQYHIMGEGPDREQITFLVCELNLEKEVKLHGRSSASDIKEQLLNTHIYLQTSHSEGFSNACLEAQSFGIPCVVPDISGMRACVEHGKSGMIVDNRNESDFAQAIQVILKNKLDYNSQYISERVKSTFTLEKQREAWLEFFSRVVS
jgi:colanic acid/amylovoran biosynthesis glycosyltransferase